MRAVSDGLLTAGLLTVAGYLLKLLLPDTSSFTVAWNSQQYIIPYDIAAFWGCVALGVVAGTIQTITGLMRDADRLQ